MTITLNKWKLCRNLNSLPAGGLHEGKSNKSQTSDLKDLNGGMGRLTLLLLYAGILCRHLNFLRKAKLMATKYKPIPPKMAAKRVRGAGLSKTVAAKGLKNPKK